MRNSKAEALHKARLPDVQHMNKIVTDRFTIHDIYTQQYYRDGRTWAAAWIIYKHRRLGVTGRTIADALDRLISIPGRVQNLGLSRKFTVHGSL